MTGNTDTPKIKSRLSESYFFNSAVYYLQRYSATAMHLQRVLERKIMRATQRGEDIPRDTHAWIQKAVEKCVALGYVNDHVYAESRINAMRREGRSTQFILRTLQAKGVPREIIDAHRDHDQDKEMQAAQRYVQRRRLGRQTEKEMVQKDLAKLVRVGFSLDIARRALQSVHEPETEF